MIYKGKVPEYKGTQQELVYIVSNVEVVEESGIPYVFTDRHAKLEYACHYNDYEKLVELDWASIESDKWGQQYGETVKEKKQAEFLVYQALPLNLVQGIVCHNNQIHQAIDVMMQQAGVAISVVCRPKLYY